ncbi:MAG: hypothetical protein C4534_09990 [Gaiellales bacterium]|nr:MAG: hypothetical protein C4534_09990 [Gaiellales bacterium]
MDQGPGAPDKKNLKGMSVPELLADLSRSIPELIRAEIALLKAQAREKAGLAGQGAGLIFAALIFLSMAIATGTALAIIVLDLFLPLWLAALAVTLLWLLIAAALAFIGVHRFKKLAADGEDRPPAPGSGKSGPGRGRKQHASAPGGGKPAPKRDDGMKSAPAVSDARAEAPQAETQQDSPATPAEETAGAPGQKLPAEPDYEHTTPEGGAGLQPEPEAATPGSDEEDEA